MFMAVLILMVYTGLLVYYIQAICQRPLRRQFAQKFYQAIVKTNQLGYPSVRSAIEDLGSPVEYPQLIVTLKCDFLALTYLLKNTANVHPRYTYEQYLLILYFKLLYVSLVTRHWLGLRETPAVLKLTAILQYFANVVGERVNSVQYGNLAASNFVLDI